MTDTAGRNEPVMPPGRELDALVAGGRSPRRREATAVSNIGLDQAAVRRQLVALGVPRHKAESIAHGPSVPASASSASDKKENRQPPAGPVMIVLQWSCLCSDNQRHTKLASHSAAYKLARTRAHAAAAEQWGERAPFQGRVSLTVVLHAPDARRRDVANFIKCAADSLTGIAYLDDAQIDQLVVSRGTPDVDRPRAEITVKEIAP